MNSIFQNYLTYIKIKFNRQGIKGVCLFLKNSLTASKFLSVCFCVFSSVHKRYLSQKTTLEGQLREII